MHDFLLDLRGAERVFLSLCDAFPGADVLHVGRTDHFGLLNHPKVHAAMRDWLA